jgi:hypothetical protein
MKLPRLIALHYGLAAVLLSGPMLATAETPNDLMIDHQQNKTLQEKQSATKAKPQAEARPAVTSSHKEHSVQSSKGEMIKEQKKAAEQGVEDTEASKPKAEARPAAVTSHKKHSAQSSKGEVIKSQKRAVEKELSDAEAAKKSPVPATAVN